MNNDVTYYYIELEKFRNQNPDMTLPINQWLAFIDMEKGELLEMAEKENKLIKKAKENYDILIGDDEVKRLAEIRLMSQLEEQAALESARDKGARKGMELGKKEGMELGRKEGMELGEKEEKIETASKLIELKMPIEKIKEITGLSEEEIRKI